MAGGGSIVSIGPILENFLFLKATRGGNCSEIERELLNHLGNNLTDKINILTQVVLLNNGPYTSKLLDSLKSSLTREKNRLEHNDSLIEDATRQLTMAIESRNKIALEAALYPSWYHIRFHNTQIYREGEALLRELS
jgi:hypothetical protein